MKLTFYLFKTNKITNMSYDDYTDSESDSDTYEQLQVKMNQKYQKRFDKCNKMVEDFFKSYDVVPLDKFKELCERLLKTKLDIELGEDIVDNLHKFSKEEFQQVLDFFDEMATNRKWKDMVGGNRWFYNSAMISHWNELGEERCKMLLRCVDKHSFFREVISHKIDCNNLTYEQLDRLMQGEFLTDKK